MRTPSNPSRRAAAVVAACLVLSAACAHAAGRFVWVDQVPEAEVGPAAGESRFGAGDLVAVQVFGHAEMSTRARVRDDGRLSIPLLGEVTAAGQTPGSMARLLEGSLTRNNLVPTPTRVTVALEERPQLRIAVLGEVARPGLFALDPNSGVAEALASAGGFTDFAHRDRVYVVRRDPAAPRIRLRFDDLARGRGQAAALRLRPGDVVVVE